MEYKDWLDELEREMNSVARDQFEVELSLSLMTGTHKDTHKIVLTGRGENGEKKELSFDITCNMHVSIFNIINELVRQIEAESKESK